MTEGEPEPSPQGADKSCGYESLFNARISRCLKTHYQLLQLTSEVASVTCYFSCCAPYFLRLAEKSKQQAGVLMDLIICQGGSVKLPALESPCCNLSYDREEGEQTLLTALEACLQLEESKKLSSFQTELKGVMHARVRKVVEDMAIDSFEKQEELARLASSVMHASTKLEGLAHMRAIVA